MFKSTNALIQLPNWYGLKAETLLVAGDCAGALVAIETALSLSAKTGDKWFLARVHSAAARVNERLGQSERVETHLAEINRLKRCDRLADRFVNVAGAHAAVSRF